MKKIITRFWGVALIVMMISSLFIAAAPVSADATLQWDLDVTMPTYVPATVWTQYPGTDIWDFASSADGMTIYAALHMADGSDNTILLKSPAGGAFWMDLTAAANNRVPTALDSIDYVAVSVDNPDVVVVLDAGGSNGTIKAAASTDGGNNFYDMGTIQDSSSVAATAVYDLDVSPVTSNNIYYVAIAGTSGANKPTLYYYNFGASVGVWRDAVRDFGTAAVTPVGAVPPWLSGTTHDSFRAVKFTPDGSLLGLSENGTALTLHLISLASHMWDTSYIPGSAYPVDVFTTTTAATVNAAAVAVGPDFVGSESETQVSFTAASIAQAGVERGGISRVDESGEVKAIKTNTGMNSIDYDGVTVVAGAYIDNNVYRVTDPLSGSPSAASARSLKRIGVNTDNSGADTYYDMVVVRFAGENVLGTKRGDASAISKSTDLGNTWNDFSLMDSANTFIDDLFISPDDTVKYQASRDGGETSIYRVSAMGTQRVLCVSQSDNDTPLLLLRGIPSDPNVVYAYDSTGTDIYQTSDGGVSRWSRKTTYPGGAIADLAVESSSVIYASTGQLIYKSTNGGSNWATGVDTGVNIYSILSLGDGKLLVGGTFFYVGWSTDGGASWAHNGAPIGGANFIVAATGLTADDYVFAAPYGGTTIVRAHPMPFVEFKTMNFPGYGGTATTTDMVLTKGILYVEGCEPVTADGIYVSHSRAPTIPTHSAALWGTQFAQAGIRSEAVGLTPVLRTSFTSDTVKLYSPVYAAAIFGNGVYYFNDIVSLATPTLIGPDNGTVFQIVSTMLADSQLVNFTWNRASPKITSYNIWVALDKDFTKLITAPFVAVASTTPSDIVSYIGARGSFQPGLTYYWKVNANLPFDGPFSEVRSFTIAPSAATVPDILSPTMGGSIDTTSPVFTWSAVTSATKYDFQISELPGFETTVFTDQTTSPAEALPVTISLERGKTYFWRVRAIAPIMGDWSTVGTFTIAKLTTTPPPPPTTQTTITIPPPPAGTTTIITLPTTTAPEQIAPAYIWAIIVIGAILVIAVIVLIVRTRRSV
jgi:hypothetical protein